MSRSPNLTVESTTVILELLDGWTGKLSWELLIDRVERKLLVRYTRQAFGAHERIVRAFQLVKRRLRGQAGRPPVADPALQKALETTARMHAEIERLKLENERLTSTFIRWAYNARLKGIGETYLERPLPDMGGRRGTNARANASRQDENLPKKS